MTVIGLDDTDSRDRGMCTTYVADSIARRLAAAGAAVERVLLVRCNPAVEYKTRGNAALAVHTDADASTAADVASKVVEAAAETADDRTNPGVVVGDGRPGAVTDPVVEFSRVAVTDHHTRENARRVAEAADYRLETWKNGRGVIGALAAVGAWAAFDEWTYEHIAYRNPDRWGTPRDVDGDSVFAAADATYPSTSRGVPHRSGFR